MQPGAVRPQPAQPAPVAPIAAAQPAARKPEAIDSQPAARQPTAVVAPKPKPQAQVAQREAQPGDRICGQCGEPNDPSRKFCRRCGSSLVAAKVVEAKKLPWYRRIFGGRKAKQYAAGERIEPMAKGSAKVGTGGIPFRRIFAFVVMVLVGLGVISYVALPSVNSAVSGIINGAGSGGITGLIDGIRKAVAPKLEPVRPTGVTASSFVANHPPELAFDTFYNTDWQADDKVTTLTATFKDKVDLGALIVYPGNSDKFVDFRRPSKIQLDYSNGTSQVIDLQDVKDKQTFDLSASGVDQVVIKVLATNGPEGAPVSISELEFFQKG